MARVGLLAVGIALGVLWSGNGRADEADPVEALFRAGNRAFAAGDYPAALTNYREAWSLRKSFDIACNLGRTEAELDLPRDAAEHLDYCLRTFSVSSRTEVKDANRRFRDLFQRERAKVGVLDVEASPAGATIAVDGTDQGTAPLGRSLFVEPGSRQVRARLPGYQDRQIVVDVVAGSSASVRLELVASAFSGPPLAALAAPVAAQPGQTPSPDSGVPPDERSGPAESKGGMQPRTIVVLSGAALTLVGIGIGLGFTLDANSARNRAAELEKSMINGGVPCAFVDTSHDCEELRSALERQDQSRDIAAGAFLGSAIASTATLALWLVLPDSKARPATGFRVLPEVATADGFGLALSGHY